MTSVLARVVVTPAALASMVVTLASCAGDSMMASPHPPSLVTLRKVAPSTILPRSTVVIEGDNLSGSARHSLLLAGSINGDIVEHIVELEADDQQGLWLVDEKTFSTFGEGTFSGTAQVTSRNEWAEVEGPMLSLSLRFARHLKPTLSAVGDGVVFLNSGIPIIGSNLLMGGAEGRSMVWLEGCFLPSGTAGTCETEGQPVEAVVVAGPEDPRRRQRGLFAFEPAIAGIHPGVFEGTATLLNQHSDGTVLESEARPTRFNLQPSLVTGFEQTGVSIGQILRVRGQGLIDGTSLRFSGTFTDQLGRQRPAEFEVVTRFERSGHATCVVEEDSGFGQVIDLRKEYGVLYGSWTAINRFGASRTLGEPASISLGVLPIKQVVWIRFTGGWEDALRKFGLQAADRRIRERILAIFDRDYAGVNLEARLDEPLDFKLYSRLDITGRDPNNAVQFGLDATPGKDTNNQRLHDVIGGVNAETQDDNYRPYGGVFAESILGISTHPPAGVYQAWIQSALFDAIFDPVRPDSGQVVTSAEVNATPVVVDTNRCPGSRRAEQVACAIQVLGNLIGTTATHEVGHTLGLAKPYNGSVVDCHNDGEQPNRIMDSGNNRPFEERAELEQQGPAVFCRDNYQYLRMILPTGMPAHDIPRPGCS